jgi:O-antigen/teichoic acid export membrane protein
MLSASHWLVGTALKIPLALQPEATAAIYWLALSVPLVISCAGFRGILEAQGRFLTSNAVRAPLGVWLFAGPLLLLPFGSKSLAWVAFILFAGRVVAWIAYLAACLRTLPVLRHQLTFDTKQVGPLLRFGGWMTVSNVVSPMMAYMDRFLLGNRISLEAVAWYTTPFEVVSKLLVISSAVTSVLFPLFSALNAKGANEASRLYGLGVRYMALLLFLPTFGVSLFAREGLTIWLGANFASHSVQVAQWLALGCLLNSVATVPYALIQGAGRPDLTAKIHLLELGPYLILVFALTSTLGIVGTAMAWTARMGADLLLLQFLAWRLGERSKAFELRSLLPPFGVLALFALSFLPLPLVAKTGIFCLTAAAEAWLVWKVLLERDGLGHLKDRMASKLPFLRAG